MEEMLPILEKFDYNTFLNFVIKGDIKGRDLLALCDSSKKFNDFCNRNFNREDKDGNVVKVENQYLFRVLLSKASIRLTGNKSPKRLYIQRMIGGRVWAFGSNNCNLLGTGDFKGGTVPMPVLNLKNIVEVSSGKRHTLCLDNQGKVWSFGQGGYGALGLGNDLRSDLATLIPTLNNIVQTSVGDHYSVCLDDRGQVWSFGYNILGQLGLGDNENRNIPTLIPDLNNIIEISTGEYHCLCLDDQGRVWSFGSNQFGQLGLVNVKNVKIPTLIPDLDNVLQISANSNQSFIIKI
jgi:alpha-tubulin suppressor-like RCC1 family protein